MTDGKTKRIIMTGGTGKAGRHAVQHFLDHGYQVLNLDLRPLDNPKVRTLITDITQSGQVFNALSHFTTNHEFDRTWPPGPVDAVVHFAAIPRINVVPDDELFRINTLGTYHVIEAATKLGIRKIVVASSETVYGLCFAQEHRNPEYFPLDEAYPVDPMDSYALSKICNERTARAFALRTGMDIYALRIGNVISPEDYVNFPTFFETPVRRKRNAWSYIDARDLGQVARLCVEKDGLGFEVFNVSAGDVSSDLPTAELLRRFYPGVPVRKALGEFETLLSNAKSRDVLGFDQKHWWRQEVGRN